jgi:hypothetical protein
MEVGQREWVKLLGAPFGLNLDVREVDDFLVEKIR